MDTWNKRLIPKPPVITEKASRKVFQNIFNNTNNKLPFDKRILKQDDWMSSLQDNLNLLLDALSKDESSIVCENSGLFALLYHYQHQRNEKYIQNMKGVGKCLRNYDEIRMTEILADVIAMLSQNADLNSTKFYIPSRKFFNYFIIRLIGCFYLLLKLTTYCYDAAYYLTQKIAIGHVYTPAAIFLSIMGRMRVLSLDMANLIANHFDYVLPFYYALKKGLSPMEEVEDFPDLVKEMRNFVHRQCECENSVTLRERYYIKKVEKISKKLNKRQKQLKELNADNLMLSKIELKKRKKKNKLKRKLGEMDTDVKSADEFMEDSKIILPNFYKKIKTKNQRKIKRRKFKAD